MKAGLKSGTNLSIRATLLLIATLLNTLLAAQAAGSLWRSWNNYEVAERLKHASYASNILYLVEKRLSQERGAAMSALYTAPEDMAPFAEKLTENRREGEEALGRALALLERERDLAPVLAQVRKDLEALKVARARVDAALKLAPGARDAALADQAFAASTALVGSVRDLIEAVTRPVLGHNAVVTLQTLFKYFVWQVTEDAGKEYAIIARLIAENRLASPEVLQQLLVLQGRIEMGWENVRAAAKGSRLEEVVAPSLDEAETHYFMTFDQIKGLFFLPRQEMEGVSSYPIGTEIWLEMAAQATDSLFALKDAALAETQAYADAMAEEAEGAILFNICLFASALLLWGYSWYVIDRRVARPVNRMVETLYKATRGEPYAAVEITKRSDEISKLAQVLDAFRKLAGEREKYLADLEKSNRELDDFAYIASHDLKEPLRGLHNFSRFLIEDYGDKLEGEGRGMLETIAGLTQRMENLLNSLLHYSRLGRTEMSVRETDLNDVIRSIEALLSITLKEKNARVAMPRPLPTIVCDHVRVAEVFQNLIGNAIKYNDSEEKVVEVGYTHDHPRAPGRLVFYVRDNGIGIDARNLGTVFRIFHRLHARDAYGGGTGSGLTIAKKLVNQHHGQIWAESEGKGKGTAFYFTLSPA